MDMEERYRLITSTIFNTIGCRTETEKMIATGRIDIVAETSNIIYVMELKMSLSELSHFFKVFYMINAVLLVNSKERL